MEPRTRQPRHILFVCVPPIVELDLFGPLNVFSLAQSDGAPVTEPGEVHYRITIVTSGSTLSMGGQCGTQVLAQKHYSAVTEPVDTVIVVAGPGSLEETETGAFYDWLRRTSEAARRTASICVGAFVLAVAGLLDGRRIAVHWAFADALQRKFPELLVDAEPIWAVDHSIYTSAGVTAGIDLALALVEEDLGTRVALEIARSLVVFLKRPGGQRQFSTPLSAQAPSTKSFADLVAWIAENLSAPLTVESLADRMAMSPRNFARVFRSEIGVTPAAYVRRARLEAARALLEQTRAGIAEVAARSGFGDDEVMRRAFLEDLGVTPGQYRATFGLGPLEH